MRARGQSHTSTGSAIAVSILASLLLAAGVSCRPAAGTGSPVAAGQAPGLPATPTATATEPLLPPPPTRTAAAPGEPTTPTPPLTDLWSRPSEPAVPAASATPVPESPTATPAPAATPGGTPARAGLYSARQRLGLGAAGLAVTRDVAERLGLGWYLDWGVHPDGYRSAEVEYMPMIRVPGGEPQPSLEALRALVPALPGALWLIGNEPDVPWQDNVTPEAYAAAYHDLYYLLKSLDPTCRVAIGGVSQPTPLRLRYLERILASYQARYGEAMPVDAWNVHNFILREERGSWGVDIPPGMPEDTGTLREIDDHDSMALFRQQIVDFRRWMKARGLQDQPLIVTEYGILMPNDYGFPGERVEQFMLDTFAYFGSAADRELGMPADGYRLVQRWCWFSLSDGRYPTGNLLSAEGVLTPLGEAFAAYARRAR